jgi:hypothetical protein
MKAAANSGTVLDTGTVLVELGTAIAGTRTVTHWW